MKKRRDFLCVQEHGRKLYSRNFVIALTPRDTVPSRLGITVSVKVHRRAVRRNRLKRRIREIFRRHMHKILGTFDIVVIARKNAIGLRSSEIAGELLGSLRRKGLLG